MKRINYFVALLLLSSCSSALKIRVEVLDREALRKFPEFRRLEAEQAYSKLKPFYDSLNRNRVRLKKIVKDGLDNLQMHGTVAKSDVKPLNDSLKKKIDVAFAKLSKDLGDALNQYVKLNEESKSKDYLNVKILFERAVAPYFDLKQQLEEDANHVIPGLDVFYKDARKKASVSDDDLLDDVLTSSVVHSPYKFWRQVKVEKDFSEVKYRNRQRKQKSAYSRTLVRTFLGNSDIAITMENKGHFTVKGVRLDAAKVAEATFKGLTQSIHFLAMTTGAPVKKDNSESTVLPELDSLTKLKASTTAIQKSFNESALALANVVLRQQADLRVGTPEKKKAAVAVLKSEFEATRNQFASTNAQSK